MSALLPLLTILATAPVVQPKTVMVAAGLDVGVFVGASLQAAYFLDEEHLLTLAWRKVSSSGVSLLDTIETTSIEAGYKEFMTRRMYYQVALFAQNMQSSTTSYAGTETNVAEFSRDRFGALFAAGSQWQKVNFTFGFDWFGLAFPVAFGSLQETRTQPDAIDYQLNADRSAFKSRTETFSFFLMRVYIGLVF